MTNKALEAMDRIFNYCEEIDNHITEEERTGYKMLPDVNLVTRELHRLKDENELLKEHNNGFLADYKKGFKEGVIALKIQLTANNLCAPMYKDIVLIQSDKIDEICKELLEGM